MNPQEQVGANIRRLRKQQGMSQEDLAGTAGLHPTEISRLERGVREPRLGTLVKLADSLGVKPERLLAGVR